MSTSSGDSLRYFLQHLHLYRQQGVEEQWKCDHQTAMKCRELEEYIGLGLSLFNLMKERAHAIQDRIARGQMDYDPEIAELFIAGYQEWLKPCASVESAIRWFEAKNYQVEKAAEFRAAYREISLHEFDLGSIIKAAKDIREGRGKPLAEAIGELQRSCQP